MFRSLRWKFTAWYVCASILAVLMVGGAIFIMESRALSHRLEGSIRSAGDAARAATAANLKQPGASDPMVAAEQAVDTVAGHVGLSAKDVFVILLDTSGQVRANPDRIDAAAVSVGASLQAALRDGEHWHTVEVAGTKSRVKTFPLTDSASNTIGFVQAGKSMEDGEAALRTLVLVMTGSGLFGLTLMAAAGYLIAGKAIRPVQQSYDRQRQFISNASHELRTPLTVIRTNAESLLRDRRPKPVLADMEPLEDIAVEARYMTGLIDNLLILAEGDRGQLRLNAEPVDLAAAARSVANPARSLSEEAGLRFTVETGDALPVRGDADRLRQVLLVLLDNAAKFTPRGGDIRLATWREGSEALAEVSDNGRGMSAEELSRATDRFFSGDSARARSRGSMGLGLSIAGEVAAALGGKLELKSTPGEGTTARLRLPLAPGARPAPATAGQQESALAN